MNATSGRGKQAPSRREQGEGKQPAVEQRPIDDDEERRAVAHVLGHAQHPGHDGRVPVVVDTGTALSQLP